MFWTRPPWDAQGFESCSEPESFHRHVKSLSAGWRLRVATCRRGSISDLLRTHTRNMSQRWLHNSKPKTNEAPAVMSDRGFEVASAKGTATMTSLTRNNYIAFHKGHLLPDSTLAWILDAASRGLITPIGKNLLLIPDTRKGPEDASGLRSIGKFRKSDCLTLKQLIRKMGKARLRQKERKTAKKHEINQSIKNRKTRSGTTPLDCHFLHKGRGINETKNASVQVAS